MRVRVRGRKLGSRDHHCLSGRDAGYGFRDGISRDLSIFPRFSHFLLFLMTLGSRGARSASRDSKLSLGWRILSIFKVTMLNTCDPVRKCKIIQGFWANVAFSPGWMLGLGFRHYIKRLNPSSQGSTLIRFLKGEFLSFFTPWGWIFCNFHPLWVNSLHFSPFQCEFFSIFTFLGRTLCLFLPFRMNSLQFWPSRVNCLHV